MESSYCDIHVSCLQGMPAFLFKRRGSGAGGAADVVSVLYAGLSLLTVFLW